MFAIWSSMASRQWKKALRTAENNAKVRVWENGVFRGFGAGVQALVLCASWVLLCRM